MIKRKRENRSESHEGGRSSIMKVSGPADGLGRNNESRGQSRGQSHWDCSIELESLKEYVGRGIAFGRGLILFSFIACILVTQIAFATPSPVCKLAFNSFGEGKPWSRGGLGDFIHNIWQTVNSYKTRYKVMADKAGNYITDIDAYMAENKIPVQYKDYYRKNTKGRYEEDIKYIPNQWLSHSNSDENLQGGISYFTNLLEMSMHEPASVEEAETHIIDRLRRIHSEWYWRNYSKWIKEYAPETSSTFDGESIEGRYNGAAQFYEVAKHHGLLSDSVWKNAFTQVLDKLAEEKFTPFKNMNIVDAYLALNHKIGIRLPIATDSHMTAFFSEKLKEYDVQMPPNREEEKHAVYSFVKSQLSRIPDIASGEFKIKAPPVPPGTNARVYLIVSTTYKDHPLYGDQLLAVMKIQNGPAGLDEVVTTLASEKRVRTSETFRLAGSMSYGKLKGGDYFMLQQAAKDYVVTRTYSKGPQDRLRMTDVVVNALYTLHGPANANHLKEILASKDKELQAYKEAVKADLITMRGNCYYDVRAMETYLKGGSVDIFKRAESHKLVDETAAARINETVRHLTNSYSRIVELNPEDLNPSVIHSDLHSGNLFMSDHVIDSEMIDFSGASWSFGKEIGTGDRGNDVGRKLGDILVEGTVHKLDLQNEIIPLIKRLAAEYKGKVGIQEGTPQDSAFNTSILFYLSRFVSVNAKDIEGKKLKPKQGESQTDLLKRLYQNWDQALQNLTHDFQIVPTP